MSLRAHQDWHVFAAGRLGAVQPDFMLELKEPARTPLLLTQPARDETAFNLNASGQDWLASVLVESPYTRRISAKFEAQRIPTMPTQAASQNLSPFEVARIVSATSVQYSDAKSCWAREMAAVAHARDRESFMRIYDYFLPRMLRYLRGLGCAEMVAEELAQEALLRLWQRAESYDPQRSQLSTWLFRIARNLYIDRVRREPYWIDAQDWIEQIGDDSDTTVSHAPTTSPDAFAENAALQQLVEKLPVGQARLIRMAYFEAKTHQEISVELDMPLGTVKSTLRRAFLKLQIAIGRPS